MSGRSRRTSATPGRFTTCWPARPFLRHRPAPIDGMRHRQARRLFSGNSSMTMCAPRFEEALSRLEDAGASIVDVDLGAAAGHSSDLCECRAARGFRIPRGSAEKVPEEFRHSVRSRLEMGGTISRDDYVQAQGDRAQMRAAVDTSAVTLRRARAADAADTTAEDRRDDSDRRWSRRAVAAPDASADATVQPDRASGDFAAMRGDTRGVTVRASVGRTAPADARPAADRTQLRSVRVSTCTFVFPTPVKIDSTRLTTVTMSPPRNASQNPST